MKVCWKKKFLAPPPHWGGGRGKKLFTPNVAIYQNSQKKTHWGLLRVKPNFFSVSPKPGFGGKISLLFIPKRFFFFFLLAPNLIFGGGPAFFLVPHLRGKTGKTKIEGGAFSPKPKKPNLFSGKSFAPYRGPNLNLVLKNWGEKIEKNPPGPPRGFFEPQKV